MSSFSFSKMTSTRRPTFASVYSASSKLPASSAPAPGRLRWTPGPGHCPRLPAHDRQIGEPRHACSSFPNTFTWSSARSSPRRSVDRLLKAEASSESAACGLHPMAEWPGPDGCGPRRGRCVEGVPTTRTTCAGDPRRRGHPSRRGIPPSTRSFVIPFPSVQRRRRPAWVCDPPLTNANSVRRVRPALPDAVDQVAARQRRQRDDQRQPPCAAAASGATSSALPPWAALRPPPTTQHRRGLPSATIFPRRSAVATDALCRPQPGKSRSVPGSACSPPVPTDPPRRWWLWRRVGNRLSPAACPGPPA